MIRYAITIFLSAALLFQIQPMVAKFILPWFGGTAVVWTTSIMFFQVVLVLGYLYAHLMRRVFSTRVVWRVHIVLLLLASLSLRTGPPEWMRPVGGENLTWAVCSVLLVTVGLPFFVLSSTGPLVQAWHAASHGNRTSARDTYRLFALSNLGSMLALLSYPFVVEPQFRLQQQTTGWCAGFIVFAIACFWAGRQSTVVNWVNDPQSDRERTEPKRIAWWLLLSAIPAVLLLATTNLMCQEVASLPLLWILPLCLYLLTLMICFECPGWYHRGLFWTLLLVNSVVAVLLLHLSNQASLSVQVAGLAALTFNAGMVCHGELQRAKPHRKNLTLFYLMIALGGALGGVFVIVIAPRVFSDYCEFHVGLVAALAVPLAIGVRRAFVNTERHRLGVEWLGILGTVMALGCVLCSLVFFLTPSLQPDLKVAVRNEYGIVSIRETGGYRTMVNGRTVHGGQFVDSAREFQASAYYLDGSGPALAVSAIRDRLSRVEKTPVAETCLKIGVLGLGTGSLTTVGMAGDDFVFYEINPLVEQLARSHFSYLSRRRPASTVRIGDGRILLEKELEASGSRGFDVLIMDAFTSDSIPAHLLTREAFEIYRKHLRGGGVLVFHITNRFVDLRPVLWDAANRNHWKSALVDHQSSAGSRTRWVLMSEDPAVISSQPVQAAKSDWPSNMPRISWTDDFASLVNVIDWSFTIDLDRDDFSADKNVKPQRGN